MAVRNPFQDEERRRKLVLGLSLLLLAVVSIEWNSYRFGGSNHSIQVVWLKHLLDPTLYQRDPLLGSFAGYATYFFHSLVPIVRFFGIEPAYFVLYAGFHFLSLVGLYALARRLTGSGVAAAIACFLYLGQIQSLGATLTFSPRLTHAHVATALLLGALYSHVSGRPRFAAAICGLTLNFHALYAVHLFALLSFETLFRKRRKAFGELLLQGAIFLALGAPTLIWIMSRGDDGVSTWWPLWLELMRERSGQHTFPSTAPGAVYARYAMLLALGSIGLATRKRQTADWSPVEFAVGTALLCVAGVVFAEFWPVRRVIEAQLLRSTKWLTLLMLAYIGGLLVDSWRWGGLARTAAIASGVGLFVHQPGWTAIGLALYLLSQERRMTPWAIAFGAIALPAAALTGAAILPDRLGLGYMSDPLQRVLERPMVAIGLAGFIVLRAVASRGARGLAATSVALMALLLGYVLPSMYWTQHVAQRADPWTEVQLAAQRATPIDAVILTPPYETGFRVFSERAIVTEWKDGTQQFFSAPFVLSWHARMRDFGSGSGRAYDDFSPERLAELARKYGASYIVFRSNRLLPFPLSFANSEYSLYHLPEDP